MTDLIDVNVSGRLMVLLTRHALLDNRKLAIYRRAVSDAVRAQMAAKALQVEVCDRCIDEQLALLAESLHARDSDPAKVPAVTAGDSRDVGAAVGPEDEPDRDVAADLEPEVEADLDPPDAASVAPPAPPRMRRESGYIPPVKTMEEKLSDARKPVETLLREDCVQVGLLDSKQANKLVLGMTGKTSQQAEHDIVEQLRQVLQTQVKSFIRKSKGGPWKDPHTQEDLRQDIHAARSVRSVLMLAHQVIKEYQRWQVEHRRGGILGLFSQRKRTVQR